MASHPCTVPASTSNLSVQIELAYPTLAHFNKLKVLEVFMAKNNHKLKHVFLLKLKFNGRVKGDLSTRSLSCSVICYIVTVSHLS